MAGIGERSVGVKESKGPKMSPEFLLGTGWVVVRSTETGHMEENPMYFWGVFLGGVGGDSISYESSFDIQTG